MAGEAKTAGFMIGSATVMIGPVTDLWKLTPDANSIGLVKNFKVSGEPTYTELTQGVKNTIVYSVLTAQAVKANMEVYEFTSKNLAYSLGLDGSGYTPLDTPLLLSTAISAGGVTVVFAVGSDLSGDYPAGTWIYLQQDEGDQVFVGKTTGAAVYSSPHLTLTLDATTPIDASDDYSVGSRGGKINRVNIGDKSEQPFLAAKVVGILPEGNRPAVILFPKIRITKGFDMAFATDSFANLPFEFTPYDLVSTDVNYAEFKNKGPAGLFTSF